MSSKQEKADYEYVHEYWYDLQPMAIGRFDIVDMEGQVNYAAARKFTEERLKEIRQVEDGIKFFEPWVESVATCIDNAGEKLDRILMREYKYLAELKKGMKI